MRRSTFLASPSLSRGTVVLDCTLCSPDSLSMAGSSPAPDRPVAGVGRYRGVARVLDHGPQRRIGSRVAAAFPRRHLNLADELGEELAASLVLGSLLVLDRRPLRMSGHSFTTLSGKAR